jgi:glutaredoxin-like protein
VSGPDPASPDRGSSPEPATGVAPDPTTGVPAVTVYWRPGCAFCSSLRRGLRRSGLATREVDIWSDPEAAAFVRAHARGNETVPTVDIGGTVLVNPSARRVVDEAAAAGITVSRHLRRWWRPSGVRQDAVRG